MASGTLKPAGGAADLVLRATSLFYLGLMVVLPMAVLAVDAAKPGAGAFAEAVRDPYAWHALKLTFITALVMVVVNVFTGTATAWVLVRYPFPGRSLVNALIDLPFAVPTIVTGVMLVLLFGPASAVGTVLGRYGWGVIYHQPGIVLALLFVTYPFVIRSVQPVLMELDRAEEEAAATLGADAWTTFRRVTLPGLWPSILTGGAVSFSRALAVS
jgi:sulfate transport system permease protein